MLTRDPASIFLYIALVAGSCVPFILLYEYLYRSTFGRNGAKPEREGWRTSPHFYRTAAIVLLPLSAFVGYLFATAKRTTVAEKVMPVFLMALGVWAIFTVIRGAQTGRIDPIARGSIRTCYRERDPGAFLLWMCWNLLFGLMCLWLGLDPPSRAVRDDRAPVEHVDPYRTLGTVSPASRIVTFAATSR